MGALKTKEERPLPADEDGAWSPRANAALTELLDHIAEELAREYVRLMERAAEDQAMKAHEEPGPGEGKR